MKIHIGWLLLALSVIVFLGGNSFYKNTSIPDYKEAEPLRPIVAEFGLALAEETKTKEVRLEDLESLISQDRFSKLQSYGILLKRDEDELVVFKINRTFNFRVGKDGHPRWEQKNRTKRYR